MLSSIHVVIVLMVMDKFSIAAVALPFIFAEAQKIMRF